MEVRIGLYVCLRCAVYMRVGLLRCFVFMRRLVFFVRSRYVFFFQAEDGIRDWSVTGVQSCVFFFQAEDGIRDWSVTGVQTCALPIYKILPVHRPSGRGESAYCPSS